MFLEFISKDPQVIKPFILFSKEHIIALAILFLLMFLLIKLSQYSNKIKIKYKKFLLIIVPFQEILFKIWSGFYKELNLADVFSLHLCSMAIIMIVIILIKFNQRIFEILYFWGLGGATQALITPDISIYGFPHFRFFQVFLSHGLIIATILYFVFVENKTISKGSLKRIIIITNIYAVFIFIINLIFNTNYLFINHVPETPSLINILGPWPIYLIWLELIAILIFSVLYVPVLINRLHTKKSSTNKAL